MSDSKHTPGPWQEDDCRDACGNTTIRRYDGTVHGDTEHPPIATVYADADATLIAAAPDLLDALVSLLRQTADPDPIHPTWSESRRRAVEAIAKAKED